MGSRTSSVSLVLAVATTDDWPVGFNQPEEGEVMSEANKELALRVPLEAFVQGRVDVLDEIIADDFVDHGSPPGLPAGREGVKALVHAARGAFPDLSISISHAVAEGDLVMLHTTNTGTMSGDFAGMPASGKQATWDAVHIERISNGKIIEHWVIQDQLGMLQQLGFIPPPA